MWVGVCVGVGIGEVNNWFDLILKHSNAKLWIQRTNKKRLGIKLEKKDD